MDDVRFLARLLIKPFIGQTNTHMLRMLYNFNLFCVICPLFLLFLSKKFFCMAISAAYEVPQPGNESEPQLRPTYTVAAATPDPLTHWAG